jgi:FKBP-type peptidyl-prolyl cis-trans isomerase
VLTRRSACLVAAIAFAVPVAHAADPADSQFATNEERIAYALGASIAGNLSELDLSAGEARALEAGLSDRLQNRASKVPLEVWAPRIPALQQQRRVAAAERERTRSQGLLDERKKAPNARELPSGVIYREVAAGSGEQPQASDQVRVHYHGMLPDGSVFDSSVERGTPATFPLDRVIPCWTEAVQLMRVGGKAQLTCPSSSAYGDEGVPGRIPPGAVLTFDVELLEIVK